MTESMHWNGHRMFEECERDGVTYYQVVGEPWYAYRDSEGLHPGVPPWFEEGDVRGGEWDLETGEFMPDPDIDKWREMDMRSLVVLDEIGREAERALCDAKAIYPVEPGALAGTVYADKVRE